MNLKESAFRIKTQTNALYKLLEGMESVDWTDETPIGVTIFLKHIITEIDKLYTALPGKVYEPYPLPGGPTMAVKNDNNRKPNKTRRKARQRARI